MLKSPGLITLALLLAFPVAAQAADRAAAPPAGAGLNIAAIVGSDAISSYDLANRLKFIIVTAKLSNTPDVLERIRPQVVRSLIDEKLQMQEASKNDVVISDDDVKKAVAGIEADRGMTPGSIEHMLDENNIPHETFTQQIRAQLAWKKLLMKKIRPTVHVSEAEIQLMATRATLPAPKQQRISELQIAVIALPVDKASRENEVHKLADKLVQQVRAGASFEEVSRQFSSTSAAAGGKVEAFWVKPQQLDPHIGKSLGAVKPGVISDPIRTDAGYTIVKVYNTREVEVEEPKEEKPLEVNFKEILLRAKPDAPGKESDAMVQIAEEIAKNPGSCEDKTVASIPNLDDFDIEANFRRSLISDLPPALKVLAQGMKVGDVSTPFASSDGIRLYMLCDKKESNGQLFDHERMYQMVMQQKMELESEKYIRHLRREVFIEVR